MASFKRFFAPFAVFLLALAQYTNAAPFETVAQKEESANAEHLSQKTEQDVDAASDSNKVGTAHLVQEIGASSEAADTSQGEREEIQPSKAVLQGKSEQVKAILATPPRTFNILLRALPFSIYGKDKRSNYVALCNFEHVNWDVINSLDPQEMAEYIKYAALFFWMYVDKRPDSFLSLVVDTKDIPFARVLDGSAKTLLKALISGLNDTVQYVGKRQGRVFLVNTPVFLCPVINVMAKLAKSDVEFLALSKQEQWKPVLRHYIGLENLPVDFGGTNPVEAHKSRVVLLLKSYVKRQKDREMARSASKRWQ